MARSAAPIPAEVGEDQAEGKIKVIYEEIKATLRVPLVNLVFRVLAAQSPRYLEVAWRQLRPNIETVYFEQRADELRRWAVEGAENLTRTPPLSARDEVKSVIRVFHYVNPKLLLAVAALRAATNGQIPKLQELPGAEKRQVRTGVPDGAPDIVLADIESAPESVREIFEDIKTTLGVSVINSDYRALAQWPDVLHDAWTGLKPVVTLPEYRQLQVELRRLSDLAVSALPFRVEVNPHVLRHSGLSEADIDAVRATFDRFYTLLPGLIVNIALLSLGSEGADKAVLSPFPAEQL